jgi:alkylation response protein AidB-like acyl-CoA dehydrogenase
MDFSFSEAQQAVSDLARQILAGTVGPERLRELRADGEHLDRPAWQELADAGLVGIAAPEAYGGADQGFVAAALVLEQIGRAVAPVPFYASAICGALPIAEFGTEEQRRAILPAAISGDLILTGAYAEVGATPDDPSTRASEERGGWRLTGRKDFVPAGIDAGRIVVSARTDTGVGLFVLDPSATGATVTRQDVTNEIPGARVDLDRAPAQLLARGSDALQWTLARAVTALCAIGVGVFDEEVRLTAEYTSTRTQFDRAIASFQAVGQRAADAYIDTEAIRLTTWQAAWRLEHQLPAEAEVAAAKFWLAEGGQRVAAAAQHLHGGIGVDRDYPLHRYYLWAKWLQLALGGAHHHLLRLGRILADEPRSG